MKIHYTLIDPTKNMTVLVETPVERCHHIAVANALMADIPDAEQVGFVEPPSRAGSWARLQMMGGEFCGNATMSLGALLASRDRLAPGEWVEIPLDVSGASDPLICRIETQEDSFLGTVAMPLPEKIQPHTFPLRGQAASFPVVYLPGIYHIIVPADRISPEEAEQLIRLWGAEFDAEAVGILLYEEARCQMSPLVLVKPTDSAVWERGCGSGSASIGSYRAFLNERDTVTALRQPGGIITIHAGCHAGAITSLSITGTVRIVRSGDFETARV